MSRLGGAAKGLAKEPAGEGKWRGKRQNGSKRLKGGRGYEESRVNSPEKGDFTMAGDGEEAGGGYNGGWGD